MPDTDNTRAEERWREVPSDGYTRLANVTVAHLDATPTPREDTRLLSAEEALEELTLRAVHSCNADREAGVDEDEWRHHLRNVYAWSATLAALLAKPEVSEDVEEALSDYINCEDCETCDVRIDAHRCKTRKRAAQALATLRSDRQEQADRVSLWVACATTSDLLPKDIDPTDPEAVFATLRDKVARRDAVVEAAKAHEDAVNRRTRLQRDKQNGTGRVSPDDLHRAMMYEERTEDDLICAVRALATLDSETEGES